MQAAARNRLGVFYAIFVLILGSVLTRMLPYYLSTRYQWAAIGLMSAYLLLMASQHRLARRFGWYHLVYFPLQVAIITAMIRVPAYDAPKDYFTNLVLILVGQAMLSLPPRPARNWAVALALFSLGNMAVYYGGWEGISFGLVYVSASVMVAFLIAVTMGADQARLESQSLLADLQAANRRLQEYAHQAETLAAAEERNRLARELHDSVSQTIFSMTLTAQAARILLEKEPGRVGGLLEHLQSLSQSALAEMRSLIQHLRPQDIERGLTQALKTLAAERKEQDGLDVSLQINGEGRLSPAVEDGLYRIVQEALNNVVKHAGTGAAAVHLDLAGPAAALVIEDRGAGFSPAAARPSGHIGLASMEERARRLGASFELDATPARGTRIRVSNIPLLDETPPAAAPAGNEKGLLEESDYAA